MHHLTEAVRKAIREQNWYAALATALTLPDICGYLESPRVHSGPRYKAWWDRYIKRYYPRIGGYLFLGSSDAYALRCAYLHQGGNDVTEQQANEALTSFIFVSPPPRGMIHNNLNNFADGKSKLLLQVDIYCEQLCAGVDQWLIDTQGSVAIQIRKRFMLEVQNGGCPIRL